MNGGWWRMLGVGALSLSLCVQAQADDGRGGRGGPGGERGVAHGQPGPGRGEAYGGSWGPHPDWRPGRVVEALPRGHLRVPYRGGEYFFHDGYWYRPDGPRYVLVVPPRGCASAACHPMRSRSGWAACCTSLPPVLTTCGMPTPVSTKWSARRRGQRGPVIRSACRPPATTWWPTRARPGARPAEPRPLRVPPLGGGRERLRPGGATYTPAAEVANGYRRAMAACLSGRGYSVN